MEKQDKLILWLNEVGMQDISLVGGKNASLGEMYQNLSHIGVAVPPGFAITVKAYETFLKHNELEALIAKEMQNLDANNLLDLARRGKNIRQMILDSKIPEEIKAKIAQAYQQLSEQCGLSDLDVAVRSSSVAEDLPDASFAGQQETFLNIRGLEPLYEAIKKCFASLFTNRAICYRSNKDFSQFNITISVAVQQMIRSDSASSGVIFTIDTETGFPDVVLISAGYGLGEAIVQGQINPDEYFVFKPFLKDGMKNPVISKKSGVLNMKMVYTDDKDNPVKMVEVPEADRSKYVLTNEEIIELARYSCTIEDHYSKLAGEIRPMDIEWAKDGDGVTVGTGKIFIIQARPETVHSQRDFNVIENYILEEPGRILLKGQAIGNKIAKGKVNLILTPSHIRNFDDGAVLVTDMTDPDWEPIMRKAAAIITNRGGRTCHAAIVSRELGVPCIIGTGDATKRLEYGRKVTVNCSQGEMGTVHDRFLKFKIERVEVKDLQSTKTQVMMNVGNPEAAFMLGQVPSDGVGIAPIESIVNNFANVHPYILLNYSAYEKWMGEVLKDDSSITKKMMRSTRASHIAVYNQIKNETLVYPDKVEYLLDRLTFGISRIAAGFYPKDVIIRLTDPQAEPFLQTLLGGPVAAAHLALKKKKHIFDLEVLAIKKVRSEMKFRNVKICLPHMDDPERMDKCLILLDKHGLRRGKDGLEIIASMVIGKDIEESLITKLDGISFILLDELNDASRKLMRQVFQTIKKHGRKIGFYSHALDEFKTFAPELIDLGVDSICLFPEALIPVKLAVAQKERELHWIV
jgi:pyruvate, water dikinase